MTLHHHPGVGFPDPPGADDPQGLAEKTLPEKEGRLPADRAPASGPQEALGFRHPAGGGKREGDGHFGRGFGQDPRRVSDRDAVARGRLKIDVVEPDGIVAVSASAGGLEGREQLLPPGLGDLPDDAVAALADGGADLGRRQGLGQFTDGHGAVGAGQDLQPARSGQVSGDQDALFPIRVDGFQIESHGVALARISVCRGGTGLFPENKIRQPGCNRRK